MAQSLLNMAKDLVQAQIDAGRLSAEDMHEVLQATHQNLMSIQASEVSAAGQATPPQQVDWKKSIAKHTVICLECGASFKHLSALHLRQHNLDSRSYRQKYGIPRTQSLASKATTARRKEIAQQSRLWEKTPAYIQSHQAQASEKVVTKTKKVARKRTRARTS